LRRTPFNLYYFNVVKDNYRITRSQIITGLKIALLDEALRLSREIDHGQITSWLLMQLQQKGV